MDQRKRVVVVGAGPGGLATAMLLAQAGMQVTVLEQQSFVGGRTSALEVDGFRFDRGPTFFLYPRILREIFASVGRNLEDEVRLIRLDPQYRIVFENGPSLDATPDIPRMQAEIAKINPDDAQGFARFLTANRAKFARFTPCLQRSFLSWRDLIARDVLRLLPCLYPWRSLDRELARYFNDPKVRLAFTFQSKYLGMSPFQCPSLFSILSFLEYEHGVYHPVGGCAAVSEAMARIARELGATIQFDEPVREILFQGKRAVGVRTDAGVYPAEALVLNADFARTMTRLVPDHLRKRWSDRKIATKRFSCSTFMMYLGIEGSYDQLAHHTIYLPRDYQGNLEDIEQRHVLSEHPAFYLQNPGVTDATLAPAGMSTLYLLIPVTHMHPNVDWHKEKARFRGVAMRQLEKLGLTDLEQRIRVERIVTPHDWDHHFAMHLGATFNLAHNLGQMLHRRPRNRFDDLEGVYLVGGGTHPGSGLPVIYESARISSQLLLNDLGESATTPNHRSTHS